MVGVLSEYVGTVTVRTQGARNLALVLTSIERCGTVLVADQTGLPEERK